MIYSDNNPEKIQNADSQSELEGRIEKITYSNEETGYTVAKLRIKGYHDPVTVVGNIISPIPGEILSVKGNWVKHPRFGQQFKVDTHTIKIPATIDGIRKYLGSGLIKGIGPVMADRIVKKFGTNTLDIIEHHVNDLTKVEGLGPKRVKMIEKAWMDQKEIRDVMIFLQAHGVGSGYAAKIFKQYGHGSITVVTKNPYKLATDIFGIGFNSADKIANKLGFDRQSPLRIEAGILYIMNQLAEEGHVYYPYDPLVERCGDILGVNRDNIINAFGPLAQDNRIVIEKLEQEQGQHRSKQKAIYLTRFHVSETGAAENLSRLLSSQKRIREIDEDRALQWVGKKIKLNLAKKQIEAIKTAITKKVIVITGGPGTGKTTIINAVIKIYEKLGARILLAAPTGRASRRMSEATHYPAKTIHRILEFSLQKGGFQRNQEKPLEVDVLILDEVSMVDIILMHHLLKAIPENTTLIMVGDVNQLPSVGPGSVLKDIIGSGRIPVVELKEIFRQAGESRIITNAHRINSGLIPEFEGEGKGLEDFYFIEQEDQDKVLKIIKELAGIRIPARFGLNPVDDIQVLAPMHKGIVGTGNLNRTLQEELNPSKEMIVRGDRIFKPNDKVMQVRNNYEKEVFNGDIGRITSIDPLNQEIIVTFEGVPVSYDYTELDEITLAYAISVHKSQGSEYPAVVIPILSQHYVLLQRNLIYTAVTRGKKLVVIVGGKKALAMGIKNSKTMRRYTYLSERLKSGLF